MIRALSAAVVVFISSLAVTPEAAIAADSPYVAAQHGKPQHLRTEPVTLVTAQGPATFTMQIAADERSREVGLMFVRKMSDRAGMIFDFPQAGEQAFWMHGTHIPLDIIYVAPNGRVLSIAKRAKPYDETPLPSRGSARAVIEINGGLADKLNIQPGDKVCEQAIFHCRRP